MENLSIELPAQSWNVVLNALAQRPFAEVFELITEIKKQAEAAIIAAKADVKTGEE